MPGNAPQLGDVGETRRLNAIRHEPDDENGVTRQVDDGFAWNAFRLRTQSSFGPATPRVAGLRTTRQLLRCPGISPRLSPKPEILAGV